MKNLPMFSWDEEKKIATCIITDGINTFYGQANCHPDDLDMANEKTGSEIAYYRATIKMIKHEIDNNIKPQLAILKQLYYSMKHSSHFNSKSYENKMLQRKIKEKQTDLETFKELLNMKKQELNSFLKNKENFYQQIRNKRIGEKNRLEHLETALNAMGITIRDAQGSFENLSTILNKISQKWNNLTDIEQAALQSSLGHTQFLSLNGQK